MKIEITVNCPYCGMTMTEAVAGFRVCDQWLLAPPTLVMCKLSDSGCGGHFAVRARFRLEPSIYSLTIEGQLAEATVREQGCLRHGERARRDHYVGTLMQRIDRGGKPLTPEGRAAASGRPLAVDYANVEWVNETPDEPLPD